MGLSKILSVGIFLKRISWLDLLEIMLSIKSDRVLQYYKQQTIAILLTCPDLHSCKMTHIQTPIGKETRKNESDVWQYIIKAGSRGECR